VSQERRRGATNTAIEATITSAARTENNLPDRKLAPTGTFTGQARETDFLNKQELWRKREEEPCWIHWPVLPIAVLAVPGTLTAQQTKAQHHLYKLIDNARSAAVETENCARCRTGHSFCLSTDARIGSPTFVTFERVHRGFPC